MTRLHRPLGLKVFLCVVAYSLINLPSTSLAESKAWRFSSDQSVCSLSAISSVGVVSLVVFNKLPERAILIGADIRDPAYRSYAERSSVSVGFLFDDFDRVSLDGEMLNSRFIDVKPPYVNLARKMLEAQYMDLYINDDFLDRIDLSLFNHGSTKLESCGD